MATTKEQNERLTQVGPGTPMGNLLRRYWQPISAAAALNDNPVKKIRVLGEDLTLYRDRSGTYGLVAERCPHRCVSLQYGIPESDGLRCAYHGWVFDATGQCIEQPFEDRVNPDANYKDARDRSRPIRCKNSAACCSPISDRCRRRCCRAGTCSCATTSMRAIEIVELPCNWLQCMDNSADPVHFEFLARALRQLRTRKAGSAAADEAGASISRSHSTSSASAS